MLLSATSAASTSFVSQSKREKKGCIVAVPAALLAAARDVVPGASGVGTLKATLGPTFGATFAATFTETENAVHRPRVAARPFKHLRCSMPVLNWHGSRYGTNLPHCARSVMNSSLNLSGPFKQLIDNLIPARELHSFRCDLNGPTNQHGSQRNAISH